LFYHLLEGKSIAGLGNYFLFRGQVSVFRIDHGPENIEKKIFSKMIKQLSIIPNDRSFTDKNETIQKLR